MGNKNEGLLLVDRQLASEKKLVVREEKETVRIRQRAVALAGGDVDRARKLLRGALYMTCGQTWDESLIYAHERDDLVEEAEVIEKMERLAKDWNLLLEDELLRGAIRYMIYFPADSPFYIGMLHDLLGDKGIERLGGEMSQLGFEKEATGEIFSAEGLVEIDFKYNQAVERLMVGWEESLILDYLWAAFFVWESFKAVVDGAKFARLDEEDQHDQKAITFNAKRTVEELLEEVERRKLISQGKDLVFGERGEDGYTVISYETAMEILGRKPVMSKKLGV